MRLMLRLGLASPGVGPGLEFCAALAHILFFQLSLAGYKFPPCNGRCLKIINGNPDWFRWLFFIIFLDFNLISKQAKAISISAAFPRINLPGFDPGSFFDQFLRPFRTSLYIDGKISRDKVMVRIAIYTPGPGKNLCVH